MKKLILGICILWFATAANAQSNAVTLEKAAEILKITPAEYAEKVQSELQTVCNLKPEQAQKVYELAEKTAKNVHELETVKATNSEHETHLQQTINYGEAYIMNILDKNQLAAYSKKESILRKEALVKERQARAAATKRD